MMFGGHHHVTHAGLARQPRPSACRVRWGPKLTRQLFIFFNWDILISHRPRFAAEDTVETPMNEHPEFGLAPPLDALLMAVKGAWGSDRIGQAGRGYKSGDSYSACRSQQSFQMLSPRYVHDGAVFAVIILRNARL